MGKTKTLNSKSAGPLDASPGHLLHRALQRAADLYAEAAGPDALTQRQYAVLAAVAAHAGAAQADLVAVTGIDRSTLAELVARMITKGLLARERSAVDARANAVRLTAEGQAALDVIGPRAADADAKLLSLIPKAKREGFIALLAIVVAGPEGKAARKAEKAERAEKAPKAEKPEKKKKKKAKAEKLKVEEAA